MVENGKMLWIIMEFSMMQDEFNEEYEDVVDHSVFICTEETDQYSSSKVFNLNRGDRPVLQLKGILSVRGDRPNLQFLCCVFLSAK